jgi:N-methylhydantoinase A/oxoprolinase/acetone carboxylase beta subunit
MPEVVSVGLGGGTKIFEQDGVVTVGPESTGHRLLQEGLVFGGNTLTTTGKQGRANLVRPRGTD